MNLENMPLMETADVDKADSVRKWILLMAITLRIVMSILVIYQHAYMAKDSLGYIDLAKSLIQSLHFGKNGSNELFRTPVYPLFLSGCMLISEKYFFIVAIFLQQIVNIGAFFIWRRVLRILISSIKIQLAAEILYVIDLQSIFYNTQILTDALFQSLMLLFVYWMVLFFRKRNSNYLMGGGFLIGSLTLLRPISIYLPAAMFIGVLMAYWLSFKNLKESLVISSKFLVCALLPILVWCCRNYVLVERFTVSTVAEYNAYVYYATAIEADLTGQNYYDMIAQKEEIINDKKSDFDNGELLKEAFTLMKVHPGIYMKYQLRGMLLECIYPGQVDFLTACSNSFENGKDNLKTILISGQDLSEKFKKSIQYVILEDSLFGVAGLGLMIEAFFLIGIWGCFIRFLFMKTIRCRWYEKWMFIGIAAYFWVCGGVPFGVGAYPRFRLPYIYIILLCVAIWFDEKEGRQKISKG